MRKGQVGIYVIVAVVLVGAILTYLVLSGRLGTSTVDPEIQEVFDYYRSCIEVQTRQAIEIAGAQGGRIETGEYLPGSDFAPYSSHLNYLGFPVPYWYYVAGNGLVREDVPTIVDIQTEVSDFVAESLVDCDFSAFSEKGLVISVGVPEVKTEISNLDVDVKVNAELDVSNGVSAARKNVHEISLESKFGKFYQTAREVYSKERTEVFLENYAIDVLRFYAPVDGVEIQCGPKIWSTQNVQEGLKEGLEDNFATLKFNGAEYALMDEKREYFVVDHDVDESVGVVYSGSWPTKIEINGDGVEEDVMIAEDIGTQQGLGVMGFCYVPYHFIYDLGFPVMIQVYDNDELFQFPMVVVIDNNVPRTAEVAQLAEEESFDLCEFKTQDIEVNLFDINLNRVDGNLSYECFNQKCRLGQSTGGAFRGVAPSCLNGRLVVKGDGFSEKIAPMSTNSESFAEVILDREFELNAQLLVGGRNLTGTAIVSFVRSDGKSTSVALPAFNKVKLSEGSYKVQVYVYGNSSIVIPSSTKVECADIPSEGILGFFGSTREKCFDITIPSTKIDYSILGGGNLNTYFLESDLKKGNIHLTVERFATPTSVDGLQQNFELLSSKRAEVRFDTK